MVIWKRGEDPGRESSVEGKGWLREFVMQLSARKEEVIEAERVAKNMAVRDVRKRLHS